MRVWQFGCNIFISVLVKISALNTALFVTTRRCRISVYHFNGTFYYTYNADRRGRRALGRRDYTNILTIKFPTLLVYTWFICATLITYLGQAELEIEL